jgi:hypothetical protein
MSTREKMIFSLCQRGFRDVTQAKLVECDDAAFPLLARREFVQSQMALAIRRAGEDDAIIRYEFSRSGKLLRTHRLEDI